MSTETIYKLEPHRTIQLGGVDRYGAMGSLWGASATGFSLSGVFRDMADFAVLRLWDADDYFGHYQTTKYLPDFDFTGMVLTFDIAGSGVQQLDSVINQWIPWRSLSYIEANGQPGTVDLAGHITKVGGTQSAASTTITISSGATPTYGDVVTVWYQNKAFSVQVAGGTSPGSLTYYWQDAGTSASLTVNGVTYTYPVTTPGGESGSIIAAGVAGAANANPYVQFTAASNVVTFASKVNTGAAVTAAGYYLWLITDTPAVFAAKSIASQMNAYTGVSLPLSATVSGSTITVTCAASGSDGNQVTLYSTSALGTITASPSVTSLSGGVSAATWQVSIDFSALGITSLRQLWLTFAPQLPNGAAYSDTEFLVTVTSWNVTDAYGHRPLKIAGPGSVRVGSSDVWVTYSGTSWIEEASNQVGGTGWFWEGFAHRMSNPGDSVAVKYSCQSAHNLYLGTSLYSDRGIVSISLDGGTPVTLDCFLGSVPGGPVVTRRMIPFTSIIAAGSHTVVITLTSTNHVSLSSVWDSNSSGYYFYFDYLEAALPSDVLDPAVTYPNVMPATDFDTDHAYMLSPERLVWMLSRLGFAGELDHYLGVFWWNQRQRINGTFSVATVTFGGTWANGDTVFITIGGLALGKSVFTGDTSSIIAAHFAYYINSIFTGVWASASGGVLTITVRTPEWSFPMTPAPYCTSTHGTMTVTGDLVSGVEGTWQINDAVTPVLNRAVRDWHTDFWQQVAAQGWSAVCAFSMELVNPPDNPGAGKIYAQRFSDGSAVLTDTGSGGLFSTQCTFSPTVQAYQKEAFKEMAGLMSAAGLTPWLQFGEFLWWFFSRVQNVPVGYASYTYPLSIGTAVNHNLLTGEGVLVVGVEGDTAANTETTCTVVDPTHVTLDGVGGNGAYTGGGTISGGGMAFYDAYTAAQASSTLGRALASFWTQDDNPASHPTDVAFLAAQLKAHIDGIRSYVLASYLAAKFELLFPYDVCYPSIYWTNSLPYPQGGRLNNAVNLPPAYLTKSGSGLDRIKMEGLSWVATYRDLDKAKETIQFPYTAGTWNQADTRYLIPWFNGGCAYRKEYLFAVNVGTPMMGMWAFDQLCLMGWPLPLPSNGKRSLAF